jgi:uncharacterized protein DUF4337
MSDLAETVNEAIEKASESRLHSIIAILVAVTATFMALCNVKDGNVVQAMAQDQSKEVDSWAYYQAKSTKLNLSEAMLDQMTVQRALATSNDARALLDRKITEYAAQVQRYEKEKEAVKATAESYEKDFDRLNIRDDQLDMAEALMSISLALFGVTALTKKRSMLVVAAVFAGLGGLLGIAAFVGLSIHPDFLARLLS